MPFPAIIGAAISGAASAAGGALVSKIFGGGEKKTTNTVDYKAMVRSAEAAGINPLTALRNGGAAGFQTTHHPILSGGDIAGMAIQGAIDGIAGYDPNRQKQIELENELMSAQIDRLNAGADSWHGIRNAPTATAPTVVTTGGQNRLTRANTFQNVMPEQVAPEAVNPYPRDWGLEVDPSAPNAEAWEDRYGDLIGGVAGTVVNSFRDLRHNLYKEHRNQMRINGAHSVWY